MAMPLIPALEAEAGRSLVKSSRSAWSTESLLSRKKKKRTKEGKHRLHAKTQKGLEKN